MSYENEFKEFEDDNFFDNLNGSNNSEEVSEILPSSSCSFLPPNLKPESLLSCITINQNSTMLRKTYFYRNNELTKVNNAAMYGTNHSKVESFTLESLCVRLNRGDNVFVVGYPCSLKANDEFFYVTVDEFKKNCPEHTNPPFITKGEDGNTYATRTINSSVQSTTVVFDYDASDSTPDHLRFTNPADLMDYLAKNVYSDFGKLSYVVSYSSSAGIYDANGLMLKDIARFHIYFFVKLASDISRFKGVLEAYLLMSNSFWTETNKNGREVDKLLLDLSVMSSESLIIETEPRFNNGLVQHKPAPYHHQGELELFDTLVLVDDFTPAQFQTIAKINHVPEFNSTKGIRSVTGIKHDVETFKYSMPITLKDGLVHSCEDIEVMLETNDKLSCYSPFRIENNASCFVSLNKNKMLYLHDMGEKITYFCCDKPLFIYPFNQSLPIELFSELRTVNNQKVPLATKDNIQAMFDSYGVTVRYNQMSKGVDIQIPNVKVSIDNEKELYFSKMQELCLRNNISVAKDRLSSIILEIADEHRYHPVQEWILSAEWDGVDRFKALCDTIKVELEYEAFKIIVLLKVLQAIVAGAFEESGIKFEYVFTLTGIQGIGKTSWLKRLLPEGMIFDGCSLDLSNKDSMTTAISYAVTELGELDSTLKKSYLSDLKAFLTKKLDEVRLCYAARNSKFPRRTVFVASVNDMKFLADLTGNRRFWVVHTLSLDYQHKIDMQQLFAQVYLENYLNNDPLHLNPEEKTLQESLVKNHEIIEPLEEKLLDFFDLTSNSVGGSYMTATKVLEVMNVLADRSNTTKIGSILAHKYQLKSKRISGSTQYLMPPLRTYGVVLETSMFPDLT